MIKLRNCPPVHRGTRTKSGGGLSLIPNSQFSILNSQFLILNPPYPQATCKQANGHNFVHFHTRLRGICNLQSMVIFIPFGSSDTRVKCPYCRHDRKGVINLINLKSLTNLTSYFVRLLEKKDIIYLYINIINKVRVFFF